MAEPLVLPEWNAQASTPATIALVTGLAMASGARLVVEAGSYLGHFPLSLWNMQRHPQPYFMGADPHDGGWIHRIPDPEGTFAYWSGDFEEMVQLFKLVNKIDLAFIDSGPFGGQDQEAGMRFRHYRVAQDAVKRGGLVVVDDTAFPAWEGCQTIRSEATILLPGERGVAIWQKA